MTGQADPPQRRQAGSGTGHAWVCNMQEYRRITWRRTLPYRLHHLFWCTLKVSSVYTRSSRTASKSFQALGLSKTLLCAQWQSLKQNRIIQKISYVSGGKSQAYTVIPCMQPAYPILSVSVIKPMASVCFADVFTIAAFNSNSGMWLSACVMGYDCFVHCWMIISCICSGVSDSVLQPCSRLNRLVAC